MMLARVTAQQGDMQHHLTKEAQACHVGSLGQWFRQMRKVGLEFSDARPSFWRVAFRPESWSPKSSEARTMLINESDQKA